MIVRLTAWVMEVSPELVSATGSAATLRLLVAFLSH